MSVFTEAIVIELTKKQIAALKPFFDAVLNAKLNPEKNRAIMGQFFGGEKSGECTVVLLDKIAAKQINSAAKRCFDRAQKDAK